MLVKILVIPVQLKLQYIIVLYLCEGVLLSDSGI